MMAKRYEPRAREFRGIQPSSVAIRAKMPNQNTSEQAILKNREFQAKLMENERDIKEQKKLNLKTDFQSSTDKKIIKSNILTKVKNLQAATEFNLECRRKKLREILEYEEMCLLQEMKDKEETVLERQAKMRERAKFLKEKRETERLAFVQEKYDQKFRSECEELRSTLTKRHQQKVSEERFEQLRHKEEDARQERAFDEMYAKLWQQDMLNKAAREEREARLKNEGKLATVNVLNKQIAALAAKAEEEKQLKREEAEILKEQRALWKMEDNKILKEKLKRQQETRELLDHTLLSKAKKKAKEDQEQLAFDLKMLEQLVEETHNEALETIQRKRELREEDRLYREYLSKLLAEEKQRQKELDRLIQQEVEAAWEKRIDQWRREKAARKLLLDNVMAGRAKQLEERLYANERQRAEAAEERSKLLQHIEESKRLDAEESKNKHKVQLDYQQNLLDQMLYNTGLREEERRVEEDEFLKGQQAEKEYQARMTQILNNPEPEKLHPMRRAMLKKGQC